MERGGERVAPAAIGAGNVDGAIGSEADLREAAEVGAIENIGREAEIDRAIGIEADDPGGGDAVERVEGAGEPDLAVRGDRQALYLSRAAGLVAELRTGADIQGGVEGAGGREAGDAGSGLAAELGEATKDEEFSVGNGNCAGERRTGNDMGRNLPGDAAVGLRIGDRGERHRRRPLRRGCVERGIEGTIGVGSQERVSERRGARGIGARGGAADQATGAILSEDADRTEGDRRDCTVGAAIHGAERAEASRTKRGIKGARGGEPTEKITIGYQPLCGERPDGDLVVREEAELQAVGAAGEGCIEGERRIDGAIGLQANQAAGESREIGAGAGAGEDAAVGADFGKGDVAQIRDAGDGEAGVERTV